MRTILVNWLLEVHLKFQLDTHIFLLTCHIMDLYLSRQQIPREKLQLVGVAATLIANKYEYESHCSSTNDFVDPDDMSFITARAYTREEVMEMEIHMLKVIDYRMPLPTAFDFLCCFAQPPTTSPLHQMCRYFIELCTLRPEPMYKYKPSHIAMASVFLAHKVLNLSDWVSSNRLV
uniref:Cyclin-dependent kinase 1 n=1 Tax=Clandestinovirus TaxID=2831644 RepID=A0A8F8KSU4_9VIRU|nr:cyclin-dependent kinase 1 [Clandestinovirus]